MSIFISLGIYSQKGADGIINGDSDRKAAMEKMQEAMQDPELAKLRTDAGVDLDSQELVCLVE